MRFRLLLPGLVVLGMLLTGCGSEPVVGVVLPQTGDADSYGVSVESGMKLAINDARDTGNLPEGFQVYWSDSASDPERAAAEFRRLVAEHDAKLVLGGVTSAEAIAMIPVADDLNTVLLSPSASKPGLAERSKLFYRIYPSDEFEGPTVAKFVGERLRAQRLLLLVGNPEYVQGIEPEFEREFVDVQGRTVVERVNLTQDGWSEAIRRAVDDHEPDVAVVIAFARETLAALRTMREVGFDGRIVTTSAFFTTDTLEEAGELAEGVAFPLPSFDRTASTEPVEGFVHRYLETYEQAPDVFAAHGYDAMNLAIQALTIASPPQTSQIEKALRFNVSNTVGVTGVIGFDDYGNVKHYPSMFVYFEGMVITHKRYIEIVTDRILEGVRETLDLEQG